MDEGKQREIRQWITKAENDLHSAETLINGEKQVLDTGVFHCQQAAEKMFKAYLTYKDIPFHKVHDLTALADQCIEIDESFSKVRGIADVLTPYGVSFRYPGDVMEPSIDESKEALRMAHVIRDFILAKLSDEAKGIFGDRT